MAIIYMTKVDTKAIPAPDRPMRCGGADSAPLARDEATEALAKRLRWKMEHLDPSSRWETEWDNLPKQEREFYRLCVKAILNEAELVKAAL